MKKRIVSILIKGILLFAGGFSVGMFGGYVQEYIQSFVKDPYIIFPYDLLYAILFIIILISYALFYKNIKTYRSLDKDNSYDEDTSELITEKAFYKIISLSTFIFIFAFIWFAFSIMQLNHVSDAMFPYVFINFILSGITLAVSTFTQRYAVKLHNRKYPEKKLFYSKPNEEYFNNMDEGEKYETYKISFSVFNKMNVIFFIALIVLFTVGTIFTFSNAAFLAVALLWIVMNSIYYIEGMKTYRI